MKPVIKLAYSDFWPDFNRETDYFTRIIRRHYKINWSDQPDFLIYSVFGFGYLPHRCVRIFYTGENVRPDFRDCDYAFSFDYVDRPEHYRLPYYARRIVMADLNRDFEAELARKTRFCTFVFSDPTGIRRNQFLKKLSRYKRVDSGGSYLNNVGGRVPNKLAFLREGKFTIAFEHTSWPGYTTEKITDALMAGTMPIYWGNPLVGRDFNTRHFLNAHEFENDDELIARIVELDCDDERYLEVMQQVVFPEGGDNPFIREANILAQFDRIFTTPIVPVARRREWLRIWDNRIRPLARRVRNRFGRKHLLWLNAFAK
jgi:hypothetical protein